MSTMVATDNAIALTTAQKMRLASSFLPVVFFVVALIFSLTVLPKILGQSVPPLLPVFLVIVLLIVGYEASKSLRDLLSGVAVVEEDELVRLWHSRGKSNTRYANFALLGRIRMSRTAFNQSHVGQRYRVCYSPASRIVWSLESTGY